MTNANSKTPEGKESLQPPSSFSFAAAGWLKMYYFGCALALQDYQLHKKAKFSGSSAGALISCALVLDCDLLAVKEYALGCLEHVHLDFRHAFQLRKYVLDCIYINLTEEAFTEHREELESRLEVSVTILPGCHNKRFRSFPTYEYFKSTLIASCTASPIAGLPFTIDGEWVADGGISDFLPVIDENSITISPFYFHKADIKPSTFVPAWWACYPPSKQEFENLFRLGYDDTISWMTAKGYKPPKDYKPPNWVVPTEVVEEPLAPESANDEKTFDGIDIHKLPPRLRRLPKNDILKYTKGPGKIQDSSFVSKLFTQIVDFWFLCLIFLVFKPISYTLLYAELVGLAMWALLRAVFHDVLPTFSHRTRRSAWLLWFSYLRSLVSLRLFTRAVVGPSVEIHTDRLFDQSFVYRFLRFSM